MLQFARCIASQSITDKVASIVPKVRDEFKQLKDAYGSKSLGEYTVAQVSTYDTTTARHTCMTLLPQY